MAKRRRVRRPAFEKVGRPFADRVPTDIVENLRWRKRVQQAVMKDPDLIGPIIQACEKDPIFWLNGFGWTYDPRNEPIPRVPFILYEFQEEAFLEIINAMNSHDLVVEKSRDMGASWLCVSAFAWAWRFRVLQSLLFVSRVKQYVDDSGNPKSLFWKFDFLMDNIPKWMLPVGFSKNIHRRSMHVENPENGSVIDGESTTDEVARGDRRTAILMDEFAAVDQGHRILAATRDVTKCRIFNSTPQGVNNAFYDVRENPDIRKLRLHWSVHPEKNEGLYTTDENGNLEIIDPEGYPDDYQPILDGKLRSHWYDLQCRRAATPQEIAQELDIDYLGSGYQFFNPDRVQEAIREFVRPPLLVGDLEYDELTAEPIGFRENPNGSLRLWFYLDGEGCPPRGKRYSIGTDVSAGTGSSNSCLSGWDQQVSEKVLEFASPYIRPEGFAKQAVAIARWMRGETSITYQNGGDRPSSALLIWESNGPGRQFGSRVLELHYDDIYYRVREEKISHKRTDIPGWASTKETKLVLMGEYRDAIEKRWCINRSKEALEECNEYIFHPNGGVVHSRSVSKNDPTGAGASHGDRVLADALGCRGMRERKVKPKPKKPEVPVGCLAWRNKMREKELVASGSELGDGW